MDRFPRCACGYEVPCEQGVYQFTRQSEMRLAGPEPHYLGYGHWGKASAIQPDYPACSARLAEFLGDVWCIDVGTGYGQVPLQLAAKGTHTLAVDISSPVLRTLRAQSAALGLEERVLCARMDAYRLEVSDASVSAVLLNNIFPMLERSDLVLKEAARVLCPDGYLVLYGRRVLERGADAPYREAEVLLFETFERRLARSGWSRVWFGAAGEGARYPYFRPPVCLSAGPPLERTERLRETLCRLEENGFNRYQHIPQTVYRKAWTEARERVRQAFGPDYEELEHRRVEEPVLYLYPKAEAGV